MAINVTFQVRFGGEDNFENFILSETVFTLKYALLLKKWLCYTVYKVVLFLRHYMPNDRGGSNE
jgi:hypothetical protein